jgi:hypothetical protein
MRNEESGIIRIKNLGAFFLPCGQKKPGFPLQFLSLPAAGLRDFRFNPLRGHATFATSVHVRFAHMYAFITSGRYAARSAGTTCLSAGSRIGRLGEITLNTIQ